MQTIKLARLIFLAFPCLLVCFRPRAEAQSTDVLTYHNDVTRSGQSLHEEVLTLANVNPGHFGRLWVLATDGKVDAQPLYAAGVNIPGKGLRNVLFVATEHDTVYAFNADGANALWQVSLLGSGETPSDARGCFQVAPEIGITATPAIDRSLGTNGTIFLVAMSKDGSGHYFHRVHALDLSTGIDRVAPATVSASYPGSGDNSQNGNVVFDPAQYKERPGLLLLNGVLYTAWSSHCDKQPYTGWIIGYNERTLARTTVLNITPNGNDGAIWMSGAGLAADADGYIYGLAGNGTLDTTFTADGFPSQGDYGNAFLKLSTLGNNLTVADYFATFQTSAQNPEDLDLGSGGALVLPDMLDSQGRTRKLAVGAGKDQNIYLADRSNLGKFNPTNDNAIYQKLTNALPGGVWSMPAYFNTVLYYGAVGQPIQALPFVNALIGSPSSQTPTIFAYPGATPSVSANGTNNGIVWAVENTSPAVLHAYAATNLAQELYNSAQAPGSRDQFGNGNKFITPTIASGRVYVGTTNGVGVFGLLDSMSLTPLQAWRNSHFGNPSNVGAGADTANPSGDGLPNLLKYALGLDPFAVANPDQWLGISTVQSSNAQMNLSLPVNRTMYLSLTVNRTRRATDVGYLVEVSGDMNNWVSGGSNTITLTDTETQLTVRDNTPFNLQPRFIRLLVTNDITGLGATSLGFTNGTAITIPDIGAGTPYPSSIEVTGMSGVVNHVMVSLSQLSHTFIHDVDVLLVAPGGQNVLLMAHVGGTLGVTNINLTFDDAAGLSLPLNSQVVAGTYQPTSAGDAVTFPSPAPAGPYGGSLSFLSGSPANGLWSLYVLDDSPNDHGAVAAGWGLALTTSNPPPIISAVPDQATVINTATPPISFTVGDALTPAANLSVSGQSSNPTLVPSTNIVFGGSGINRTVTISPLAGQSGVATITLIVTDSTGATASTQFAIEVVSSTLSGSFTNSSLITIPSVGAANPYPSSINVTGMGGVVSGVTVSLDNVSHTYIHDVNVLLISPSGQNVMLMSHVGGTWGVTNINLTFDDAAGSVLTADAQVLAGTYRPSSSGDVISFPGPAPAGPYGGSLASLDGSAPNGVWSLYILDDSPNDQGTVAAGWSLTMNNSLDLAPTIVTQPSDLTVQSGSMADFSVAASGLTPLFYQWLFFGTNLVDGERVSGATTSELLLSNVQSDIAGPYSVVIANFAGSITSTVASLKMIPTLPQVVNLPASGVQTATATLNGEVTSTGGDAPAVTLFYGPADGGTTPAAWAQGVALGPQTGLFAYPVPNLSPNTPYFCTAMAVNGAGTNWATPSVTFNTLPSPNGPPPVAVLRHHYDNSNTGANLNETILNTANVNTNQFGLLYSRPVDDQIYAQPLIITNVSIPARGYHNLLIVATVNDSVYAFDADDPKVTAPYWQVSFLGPNVVPPNSSDLLASPCGTFFNISGNFGIVGTPVIDPAGGTLYLVARTKEFGTNFVQRLHALDLVTGNERTNSPVVITATYPGTGTGSISGVITFDPFKQNQRPALALVNGTVIIGWGSHCDWDPYHGWLMGYDAATLQQSFVYNTSPNGKEAAIWMSGAGPAVDSNGNIYVSTGNGSVGNNGNPRDPINRGESYLKLTPSGSTLSVASWFTPYDWPNLEANDLDLGSAGVLLIPGTSLLFSGGKAGKAYLVNRDNMAGLSFSSTDTNIVQSFQVTATSGANNIHGSPVWWDGPNGSYAYVEGESDYLRQYKFDRSTGTFVLPSYAQSPSTAPVGGMPGAFLCVSANGITPGSGILWASHPLSGNANGQVRPGILHAYDAQNVAHELWNSEMVSSRDSVGSFAKYCPPVVANGKVYLATFSNGLNVYGLGLTPPGNDALAGAQSINGSSGSAVANNFNATKEVGEPDHAGNPGGASIWFSWTAPSADPVTLDTALSGFDTLLAVYTGDSIDALTLIAANDDMNGNSTRSRLTFTPVAGTTYMIAVDGANGAKGAITLRWVQASVPLPNLSIVGSAVSPVISTETFAAASCAVKEGLIQAGTRTILRFSTQTENSGTADMYFGNPASNPLFVWAPCHAHYHFNNYMSYGLRDANGNLVAIGLKVGFCVLDVFRWDPNSSPTPLYTCSNQGIQKGWGDVYDSTLDGQWIDITGLPAGNYTIELEANPEGIIQESNYDDNLTIVPIAIGNPTAPPSNDNFPGAQTLLGGFTSVEGNNQNATKQAGEPDHAGNAGGHSLWYQWTALSTKPVTIDTIGSSFNTLLAVYTGTSLTALTPVASNDDIGSPTNLQSRVSFNATAGVVYDIAVDGFNGATGTVVLTLDQTIGNDNFAFCTFVGGVGGSIHGSTVGATKEVGEPDHAGNPGGASIWYCWTAPIAGVATFDTLGSSFNTLLAAYTGTSVSNLTAVAANDDIDPLNNIFESRVSFNATGLTMYHIAIDGFNGASGDTVLNWSLAAGSGTALIAASSPQPEQSPWAMAQSSRPVLSQRFLLDGELALTIYGRALRLYRVEVSADLVNWRPLVTTLANSSGLAYFTDKATHSGHQVWLQTATRDPVCGPGNQITGAVISAQSSRFYRAVAVGTY